MKRRTLSIPSHIISSHCEDANVCSKIEAQLLKLHQRLSQPVGTSIRVRLQNDIVKLEEQDATLTTDLDEIQQRIDQRSEGQGSATQQMTGTGRMPNESRREYLIRTGKITPFAQMSAGPDEGPLASLRDALVDAEDERDEKEALEQVKSRMGVSHRNLRRPGFEFDHDAVDVEEDHPTKRRKVQPGARPGDITTKEEEDGGPAEGPEETPEEDPESDYVASEAEAVESDEFESEDRPKSTKASNDGIEDLSGLDDGNEQIYQTRLHDWVSRRSAARHRAQPQQMNEGVRREKEWHMPHPSVPDISYDSRITTRAPLGYSASASPIG